MKKNFLKSAFIVLTIFALFFVSCKNPVGDTGSGSGGTITPTIPEGFVLLNTKDTSFQMGANYTGSSYNPDSDETQVHKVTFTRDIYICDHEVTQSEWKAVMGNNPSYFHGGSGREVADNEIQENRPVENITWYMAIAYCNERTKLEGILERAAAPKKIDYVYFSDDKFTSPYTKDDASSNKPPYMKIDATGYRLPTEAEWEYAARGTAYA